MKADIFFHDRGPIGAGKRGCFWDDVATGASDAAGWVEGLFSSGAATDAAPAADAALDFGDYVGPPMDTAMGGGSAVPTGPNISVAAPDSSGGASYIGGGGSNASAGSGGSGGVLNQAASKTSGGLSKTSLALGALAAAAQAVAGPPKQGTYPLPGPSSTAATQGPYFNAPVQPYTGPARTPVNPYAGQPASSWYTYGQRPEPNFFANNSLTNAGWGTQPTGMRKGGRVSHFDDGGLASSPGVTVQDTDAGGAGAPVGTTGMPAGTVASNPNDFAAGQTNASNEMSSLDDMLKAISIQNAVTGQGSAADNATAAGAGYFAAPSVASQGANTSAADPTGGMWKFGTGPNGLPTADEAKANPALVNSLINHPGMSTTDLQYLTGLNAANDPGNAGWQQATDRLAHTNAQYPGAPMIPGQSTASYNPQGQFTGNTPPPAPLMPSAADPTGGMWSFGSGPNGLPTYEEAQQNPALVNSLINHPGMSSTDLQYLTGLNVGLDPSNTGWQDATNQLAASNAGTLPTLPGHAHGGALGHLQTAMAAQGGRPFSTENGDHYVRGPGTGTSDSVRAALSDGEYVLTAGDVALLGGGSNEAGARKINQWREQLHREAGNGKFIPQKTQGALNKLRPGREASR